MASVRESGTMLTIYSPPGYLQFAKTQSTTLDFQKVPHGAMFVTTTIAMVYWTVFVQVTIL
jgi:hypothetical protein